MSKSFYKLLVYFAVALILLSFYCALKIGLNTDEPFHHANGALRYFYMKDTPTLLGAHEDVPKGHLFIAKTVHRLVYFSLIMLPTTGLLIAGLFN